MKGYRINPDIEYVKGIIVGLENKEGNCPCRINKDETTLCPCDEFVKMGECKCKLFIKIDKK